MNFERDVEWIDKLLAPNGQQIKKQKMKYISVPLKAGSQIAIRLLPINSKTSTVRYQHWGITDRPVTCMKTFDEECPICNKIFELAKELPEDKRKYLYRKLPNESYLFYVFKVNGDVVLPDIYIYNTTKKFLDEMNMHAEVTGQWWDDIDKGLVLVLKRKKDAGQITIIPTKPISIAELLEQINEEEFIPIQETLYKPSEEEIEQAVALVEEKFNEILTGRKVIKSVVNEEQETEKPIEVAEDNSDIAVDWAKVVDFYGEQLTLKQKMDLIEKIVGKTIPINVIECFGQYDVNSEKCIECENSFLCKDFKEIIETTIEDDKDVFDNIIKSVKG